METLSAPLQTLLSGITAFLSAHPLVGSWYTAFVRFFVPGGGLSHFVPGVPVPAAGASYAGDLGPAEPSQRHAAAADPLGKISSDGEKPRMYF